MENSDYIKIQLGTNSDVIVYFSSAGVPVSKFNGMGALKGIEANVVFVNCKDNSWYIDGINGLGETITEVAKRLKEITSEFTKGNDGKVVYFGGSMGGYGALLYGSLNDADYIIATGPELVLGKLGSYSQSLSNIDFSKMTLPNIKKIVGRTKANIRIFFGELAYQDYLEVSILSEYENVEFIGVPNCGHRVPIAMENILGMKNIFEWILSKWGHFSLDILKGKLLYYPLVINFFEMIRIGSDADKSQARQALLNLVQGKEEIDSNVLGYIYYHIALAFKDNDTSKCLFYCKVAVNLNGNIYSAYVLMAEIYENLGSNKKFASSFENAISLLKYLQVESVEYLILQYAEACFRLGQLDTCSSLVKQIYGRVQSHSPMGLRLGSLQKSLNSEN